MLIRGNLNLSSMNDSKNVGRTTDLSLIIALVITLLAMWIIHNYEIWWIYLSFIALFIIAILLFLLVANINYNNRSRIFWVFGIGILTGMIVLLLGIFERLHIMDYYFCWFSMSIPLAIAGVFYLITFVKVVVDSNTVGTGYMKSIRFIEMAKICLRSKLFHLIFILIAGVFVYYLSAILNSTDSSGDEGLGAVFIMLLWILLTILYIIVLFIGMAFVTSKNRKTPATVILFTIATISSLIILSILGFALIAISRYLVFGS